MERDIASQYYLPAKLLRQQIQFLKEKCFICQLYADKGPGHLVQATDFAAAPRVAWAVDLMPSVPVTKAGNRVILLAVDMFTGFIVCVALPDRRSETLIKAIKNHLIAPFGVPRVIRSDEEGSIYNSALFYKFLKNFNIKLLPTARAAPFSNGLAETSIKSIKHSARKFLMQEKAADSWDEQLCFFVEAHNKSCSIYKICPEELQFGFKLPSAVDLIALWPVQGLPNEYLDHIVPRAEKLRELHQKRVDKNAKAQRTYKNKSRELKSFKIGQLVLHRQMQLATSSANAFNPIFEGPHIIIDVNNAHGTCTLEHLVTGEICKSHFTNIQLMYFNPGLSRLTDNFTEDLFDLIPLKQTQGKYYEPDIESGDVELSQAQYVPLPESETQQPENASLEQLEVATYQSPPSTQGAERALVNLDSEQVQLESSYEPVFELNDSLLDESVTLGSFPTPTNGTELEAGKVGTHDLSSDDSMSADENRQAEATQRIMVQDPFISRIDECSAKQEILGSTPEMPGIQISPALEVGENGRPSQDPLVQDTGLQPGRYGAVSDIFDPEADQIVTMVDSPKGHFLRSPEERRRPKKFDDFV